MAHQAVALVADALVLLGLLVMSLALYGMIWMPDVFTKLHASSKGVVLGVMPVLAASIATGDPAVICRALLIGAFLACTAPVASHAIGRAALRSSEDDSGES
jgi:multicomponent Na+:H+ antiporter subunit G